MKKYIVFLGMGALFLTGCEAKPDGNFSRFFRSYIVRYVDVSGFELLDSITRMRVIADDGTISYDLGLVIDDANYIIDDCEYSVEKPNIVYDSLCRKNNDMDFNRELHCPYEPGMPNHNAFGGYLFFNYLSIDIVSDADYDENHKAGSSLNDIVLFISNSHYRYIESGYNDDTLLKVEKLVSELVPEDLKLLKLFNHWYRCALYFPGVPIDKTHNITVTIVTDDGRTFEDTIEVNW